MGRTIRHILAGAGRLFDFSGSYNAEALRVVQARRQFFSQRSSEEALGRDWEKIGMDMRKALNRAAVENAER